MIACACATGTRCTTTLVVVQDVVQVPWLPEVTKCHVTTKGRYAHATGSCTISSLVGLFTGSDVIKRHVTPKGVPFENVGARMRN